MFKNKKFYDIFSKYKRNTITKKGIKIITKRRIGVSNGKNMIKLKKKKK